MDFNEDVVRMSLLVVFAGPWSAVITVMFGEAGHRGDVSTAMHKLN